MSNTMDSLLWLYFRVNPSEQDIFRQQGPPYFPTFRYQWGSLTIDRHAYGKSKTAFGRSVALIETRGNPFKVYFVKIWHISAHLGTLITLIRSKTLSADRMDSQGKNETLFAKIGVCMWSLERFQQNPPQMSQMT